MVHEVFPNIFLNEIPLPNNPLKFLNSYIILSKHRNLIIDTGFNNKECKDAFFRGIKELKVDLSNTDLLLTHMHADHSGLADDLGKLGCKVIISKKDGEALNYFRSSGNVAYEKMNKALDLDKDILSSSNHEFGKKVIEKLNYSPIAEGDIIKIGPYTLKIVDTSGHSPGHISFYEISNKLFFSGDHILNEITPNISFWDYEIDSLGDYIENLKKIYALDIDIVFPAHRSIIKDCRKRIEELIAHHQERLDEIIKIIRSGRKTASQVAAKMHWEIAFETWNELPGTQKWFAASEAMSHLEHLVFTQVAKRIIDNEIVYYKLI